MATLNSASAQSLSFDWVSVLASARLNEGAAFGEAIAADAQGNTYVTGHFFGRQHFGPTTLTGQTSSASFGIDVFVVKLDAAGQVVWAVQGGGPSDDFSRSIAVDDQGNVYVTGSYVGAAATYGATTLRNTGTGSLFVAKLTTNGEWLWAVGGADGVAAEATAIAVGADRAVYVGGIFGGFDGGTMRLGSLSLVSAGAADGFVARLSPAGTWQWAARAGGLYDDQLNGLALDKAGDAYVSGRFASPKALFGTTILTVSPPSQGTSPDLFVAKLSAGGDWQWATSGGGAGIDVGQAIMVDGRGRIYVTGSFQAEAVFGSARLRSAGSDDVFTACLTPAGTWNWAVAGGGADADVGLAITGAGPGYVQVGGQFGLSSGATAHFDAAALRSAGTFDAFVTRLDSAGHYHGAVAGGGSLEDGCLGMTSAGKFIYLTGYFSSSINESATARFGPHTLTGNPTTYARMYTGWVARMSGVGGRSDDSPLPDGTAGGGWDAASNLPNIITPNGDGHNDTFAPKNLPVGPWQLTIYSRWGTRVFESLDYQSDWGAASPGIYYFLLRHLTTDLVYKGWLEVVR